MSHINKTVFLSYRRVDGDTAHKVYQDLDNNDYDIFLDDVSVGSGSFEKEILTEIAVRDHFLVILTPTALKRCTNPDDLMRHEIEYAIEIKRNVIPLLFKRFQFGKSQEKYLVGKLAVLSKYNGLSVPEGLRYFNHAMNDLRSSEYLNKSLDDVLHPELLDKEKNIIHYSQSGNGHFDQGNFNQAIEDYSKAIELEPNNAYHYNKRGLAYFKKSSERDPEAGLFHVGYLEYTFGEEYNLAIADFTKAIELEPNNAAFYHNRGDAFYQNNKYDLAIADFEQVLIIDTNPAVRRALERIKKLKRAE